MVALEIAAVLLRGAASARGFLLRGGIVAFAFGKVLTPTRMGFTLRGLLGDPLEARAGAAGRLSKAPFPLGSRRTLAGSALHRLLGTQWMRGVMGRWPGDWA